ncbi:hypothetical protein N3K66_003049 [Trichothecium roseum]|uniref:Uncharacterized protein n=1 Tax=Trichothecium roseum TaxID=47278 RepID=A0ACC0V633_9HYPO|nr:hypothetical protein N3K66_003049 [Trichothecium roseum]
MVSQPETQSAVSLRGPSSVISRPSLSRTKRYNRSHTGGTSYTPSNEFPVFSQSGDVEIVVIERRYLLHKHTLTRCSGFFEASTSEEWSKARPLLAGGNELTRIGEEGGTPPTGSAVDGDGDTESGVSATTAKRRWRYELDPGKGPNDVPMLVQKDEVSTTARSRPRGASLFGDATSTSGRHSRSRYGDLHSVSLSSNRDFSRSVANVSSYDRAQQLPLSEADQNLLRDYDNLFRIFYNYPPTLDGVNVADAYVQCKSLLNLADQYDALAVVGPRVDHHMLQFQSRLWKQIAKYPISYLRLGYLSRSRVIFQEALIHVVGQWPAGERSLRANLPDMVLDLIEDKVDELEETVSRVEGQLFRLNLITSRGERVTPHTSYLDWLAISLFRQWLADNTTPQPPPDRRQIGSRDGPRPPPPMPAMNTVGRAYRTLGHGHPGAYLTRDDCKRFLKLTPDLYSRDNLKRFEKRIDELKAMARGVVQPLMGSGLELDMAGSSRTVEGIGYLTCTAVGHRDLPWPVED